ncbi:hypothetical protein, variant [Aphanomyces invadans]|uniref:Uncharacterized protein n=1 Tax=Aphanomyces invadans TaxID=157072 RepID=A0A024TSK3_9STRA|nr:hypothetical protein H310_09845 [Aphanomyces invadans]XP_008874245.1 hypothetical protein, variant [Aphanomyces invadans]ETV96998.1 hypothetical protein H310_09845 [Aphanomyces invadans]ETV96999.1 hypothetical protein, variant [Aphanomyces invadans]|eukprot:XP_008874244.1 hypothetical protein H310_09845 [Aphanomyces invadans]
MHCAVEGGAVARVPAVAGQSHLTDFPPECQSFHSQTSSRIAPPHHPDRQHTQACHIRRVNVHQVSHRAKWSFCSYGSFARANIPTIFRTAGATPGLFRHSLHHDAVRRAANESNTTVETKATTRHPRSAV